MKDVDSLSKMLENERWEKKNRRCNSTICQKYLEYTMGPKQKKKKKKRIERIKRCGKKVLILQKNNCTILEHAIYIYIYLFNVGL